MQVYRFLQTVARLAVIFWRDVKKQILLPYVISAKILTNALFCDNIITNKDAGKSIAFQKQRKTSGWRSRGFLSVYVKTYFFLLPTRFITTSISLQNKCPTDLESTDNIKDARNSIPLFTSFAVAKGSPKQSYIIIFCLTMQYQKQNFC